MGFRIVRIGPRRGFTFADRYRQMTWDLGQRVEQHAAEMARPVAPTEKLRVQQVQKARDGEPIGRFSGSEGPRQAPGCEARGHVQIVSDELRGVEVYKIKVPHRCVHGETGQQEDQADSKFITVAARGLR